MQLKKGIIAVVCFFLIVGNTIAQTHNEQIYKLSRVFGLISTFYVDSVNENEIVEAAIIQMLKELDPHSVYISKEEVKALNEPLEGSFEGIGIYFNILNDTVIVISTIAGGPSEKVGLKAGDRIVEVEDEKVAGINITNKNVRDKLLGAKGTKVNIKVKRPGVKKKLKFTITRDKIPIFSLDASYKISENIGYIKLNRFSATSTQEFQDALDKLKKQGVTKLILDLQENGGGYLNVAIELADEFLSENRLIVYTEGTNSPKNENFSSATGNFETGQLVILIDEGSASASEILSGAIQDWDRGVIIGRRSFGKGLVQRPFTLPDGSMIRLTIARYYTPTGRLIQKPYTNGISAYKNDIKHRYQNGELTNIDSIKIPDTLKYYTMQKHRIVYGGGGIMPDIFIPLDTTKYSETVTNMKNKGILYDFCLEYVDKNRKQLKKEYPKINTYKENFTVNDAIINELIEFAQEKTEKFNKHIFLNDIEKDSFLKTYIKAQIAADLWDTNEYYQIINTIDPTITKAIEVLENEYLYEKILTP